MSRKTLGAEEWKSILDDWQASGLGQADYCRKKNLNIKTFSSWKGKLVDKKGVAPKKVTKAKTRAKSAPKKAAAARATTKPKATVSASAPPQSDGLLVATLPSGVEIRFTCDNEQMLVAAINTLAKIE